MNCIHLLPKQTIGIHWFNGSDMAKKYQINMDKEINNDSTISTLIRQFMDIIKKDDIYHDIQILNPNYN